MKYILPKNKSDFVCTTSFKKLYKESFFDYNYTALLDIIIKMSDNKLLDYYHKENCTRDSYYIKKEDTKKLFTTIQMRLF